MSELQESGRGPYNLEPLDKAYISDLVILLTTGRARTKTQLARQLGINGEKVERLLNSQEFKERYDEVSTKHMNDCLSLAKDEKMDPIVRARALKAKAQTVMAHALKQMEQRIEQDNSADPDSIGTNAAEFRAAATLIKTALDDAARSEPAKAQQNIHVHAHFKPTDRQQAVFDETFKEAAVDITDITSSWVEEEPSDES